MSNKIIKLFIFFLFLNNVQAGVNFTGTVYDTLGNPVEGATVNLWNYSISCKSDANGKFSINSVGVIKQTASKEIFIANIKIYNRQLFISSKERSFINVDLFNLQGKHLLGLSGFNKIITSLNNFGNSIIVAKISMNKRIRYIKLSSLNNVSKNITLHRPTPDVFAYSSVNYIQASKNNLVSSKVTLHSNIAGNINLILNKSQSNMKPSDYVDPFIGTAVDFGQLYPGASLPWGLVKLSPDTDPGSHVGYDFNATKIRGFSHTRIGGVGCDGIGGSVLVQAGVGNKYVSTVMDKNSEYAEVGYYTVTFGNPKIKAEVTTSNKTGIHRYTYPASKNSFLNFDLKHCYGSCCFDPEYEIIGDSVIVGKVSGGKPCCMGKYTLYFSAICSKHFTSVTNYSNNITCRFSTTENEQVLLKIGFSTVSTKHATETRNLEIPSWNFDSVKIVAQKSWNNVLGLFEISGSEEFKTLFYTHLYHSCLQPSVTGINSKSYTGVDCQLHDIKRPHYETWSTWDTFRTKYPLLSIFQPQRLEDMAQSLVLRFDQWTHKTTNDICEYTPNVRTEHSIGIIADAFTKGMKNFDSKLVFENLSRFLSEPVHTFEKAWDYWCIAQMAKDMGRSDDYNTYIAKSDEWKEPWDNSFKNVMSNPLADSVGGGGYEGTLWQYRWFVPHDVQGLIIRDGGKESFVNKLSYFFDNSLYNHGNEPDLQAPYLFNYAGNPWLTQKWVKNILTKPMIQKYGTHDKFSTPYYGRIYKTTPDAYIPEMDDDVGTLSAWFVLSSIGLYQVCPGRPIFEIGTPIFKKTIIHLDNNINGTKTFTIIANNISDNNFYIKSATLNSKPLNRSWLTYKEIVNGGELIFEMASTPNKLWGTSSLPPSQTPVE